MDETKKQQKEIVEATETSSTGLTDEMLKEVAAGTKKPAPSAQQISGQTPTESISLNYTKIEF
jgi:type VI protein secretion system component Hcp